MGEQWWSIEVLDGAFSAAVWQDSHGSALVEAALTNGVLDWAWHHHSWGVVFEMEFRDSQSWDAFRALPAVRAALDAVPDPVNGLLVYRGWGGSAGAANPRRPRPIQGAGSAALPQTPEPLVVAGHVETSRQPPELALAS